MNTRSFSCFVLLSEQTAVSACGEDEVWVYLLGK